MGCPEKRVGGCTSGRDRSAGAGHIAFDLGQFDLIIALSPASQRQALELTRFFHMDVEYWPIIDPTAIGETREAKLQAYRQARDMIRDRMIARFGAPTET